MKHHFGDMLDREYGHWTIKPNRERWGYNYPDLLEVPDDLSILTLTKDTKNWERLIDLRSLEELTLHECSKEQLLALERIGPLKKLRITHARPKSLDLLESQQTLEELILEYVSGFDNLNAIGSLPQLTSLHLENLRRVRDFSPLSRSKTLKYLSIDGTFDWKQPIESLSFLSNLDSLEYLRLQGVRVFSDSPVFQGIDKLKNLKKVNIYMSAFPLKDFAYLEAVIPNVEGAVRAAYIFKESNRVYFKPPDMRATMSEKDLKQYPKILIDSEGRRYCDEPATAFLLGKGSRTITGVEEKIKAKCAEFEIEYRKLVQEYKSTQ